MQISFQLSPLEIASVFRTENLLFNKTAIFSVSRLLILMAIAIVCVLSFNGLANLVAEKLQSFWPFLPLKEPIQLALTFLLFIGLSRYLNFPKDNRMPLGTIDSVCYSVILLIGLVGVSFLILAAFGLIMRDEMAQFGIFEIMVGSLFMVMHGASEQLISQGIVHVYARGFWGKYAGIAAAALCFALTQILQGYNAPILIINSLILGTLFAIIAARFGLMGAIFAHGAWTWFEVLVLGQVFGLELKPLPPLFIDSDSYGTIVLTFTASALCFLLLFFKQNDYKDAHDTQKH